MFSCYDDNIKPELTMALETHLRQLWKSNNEIEPDQLLSGPIRILISMSGQSVSEILTNLHKSANLK